MLFVALSAILIREARIYINHRLEFADCIVGAEAGLVRWGWYRCLKGFNACIVFWALPSCGKPALEKIRRRLCRPSWST